jgi:hypothetical protein
MLQRIRLKNFTLDVRTLAALFFLPGHRLITDMEGTRSKHIYACTYPCAPTVYIKYIVLDHVL